MSEIIPDIPTFEGEVQGYEDVYAALKMRQRGLLKTQLQQMQQNLLAYATKRGVPANLRTGTGGVFKQILSTARFIPADSSRYVSGFDLTAVKYFVLHRPSTDTKASTLENIIITFTQYDEYKAAVSRGFCPSTHFAVGQQGELIQFVDLADRAFHVSVGNYNATAIGVELEGAVGAPISVECYTTLAKLLLQLKLLCPNLKLDANHVVEHRQLEPNRRSDVGAPYSFDILEKYINQYRRLVTTASFTEYSVEAVNRTLTDTIVDLSSLGLTLAGLGREEQKKLRETLKAAENRYARLDITRGKLVGETISNLSYNSFLKMRVEAQRARVAAFPVSPVPVQNGAGVKF